MTYVGIISLWFRNSNFNISGKPLNVKEKETLYLSLIFSVLILVAGFRNNSVGIDTKVYEANFELIKAMPFSDIFKSFYPLQAIGGDLEIGYVLLGKISSFFSDSYYFFQVVIALITGFFSAKFIHENSDDAIMSTILFLGLGMYLSSFNVARQWMAASVVCNGWSVIRRSKVKGFLLLVIGFSFHFATILIAFAALVYIFKNSKFLIKLIPIIIVFAAFRYQLILDMIAPYLPSKYAIYLHNWSEPQPQVLNLVTYALIFALLIMFVILGKKVAPQHKLYAIMSAVYATCDIIGMSFNKFDRLGWPFMYFVLVMIPAALKYIQKKWIKRAYYCFIVLFYSFLFVHRALNIEQFIYTSFLFN